MYRNLSARSFSEVKGLEGNATDENTINKSKKFWPVALEISDKCLAKITSIVKAAAMNVKPAL